jgi:hypothetical protein
MGLLDVDTIEGKIFRRYKRDSDKTNHAAVENVLRGHGGWVTVYSKGFASFVTLEST